MEHPATAGVRIEHARDELGRHRRGLLLVYAGTRIVGSAARVAGAVPESWVAHRLGSESYTTGLSEVGARALLTEWAQS